MKRLRFPGVDPKKITALYDPASECPYPVNFLADRADPESQAEAHYMAQAIHCLGKISKLDAIRWEEVPDEEPPAPGTPQRVIEEKRFSDFVVAALTKNL